MDDHRLYSDEEAQAIIQGAVRLQRAAQHRSGDALTGGVSLAHLKELASEAGIDPDHVARAAALLGAQEADGAWHFWGGPASYTLERVLEGEIPPDCWGDLAAELVASLPGKVTLQQVGDLLQASDQYSRVLVRSAANRTRLLARSRFTDAVVGVHATLLSLAIIPALLLAKGGIPGVSGPLAALAVFGAAFLGGRAIVAHLFRKSRAELRGVLDRLTARLESVTVRVAQEPAAVANQVEPLPKQVLTNRSED
jgi:hypothetical protein